MPRNFLKNLFRRLRIFDHANVIKIERQDLKASNYVDEYLRTLERYKFLKNTDLPNVSDDKLIIAVMSWMWKKFENDGPNQNKFIFSLPTPCQNVYCCRTVADEVHNGGFNQLFFNCTRQLVETSVEGFLALGAIKLSDVTAKAVESYNQNESLLNNFNDGTVEGFSASYSEGVFNELDNIFFEEYDLDDEKCVEYIRRNAGCFGD